MTKPYHPLIYSQKNGHPTSLSLSLASALCPPPLSSGVTPENRKVQRVWGVEGSGGGIVGYSCLNRKQQEIWQWLWQSLGMKEGEKHWERMAPTMIGKARGTLFSVYVKIHKGLWGRTDSTPSLHTAHIFWTLPDFMVLIAVQCAGFRPWAPHSMPPPRWPKQKNPWVSQQTPSAWGFSI